MVRERDTSHILIVPRGVSRARTDRLAHHLVDAGIQVVVYRPDHGWLDDSARRADGVVLAFRGKQVPKERPRDLAPYERRGRMVAVRLGDGTGGSVALPGDVIDLGTWSGDAHPELERLVDRLRVMVGHPRRRPGMYSLDDAWVLTDAVRSVDELETFTRDVGSLAEVLASSGGPTEDVRSALREVSATYRVTKADIEAFIAAGIDPGGLDRGAFTNLARGVLTKAIKDGRGHCDLILVHYRKEGGLRSALVSRLSPARMRDVDDAFGTLGTADGDLFAAMERLGEALTDEAQTIEDLLIMSDDEDAARARFKSAYGRLRPLEARLDGAIAELQQIEQALGHAELLPQDKEPLPVSVQNIYIAGDVVNSNVVAAATIENSSIVAAVAPVDEELRVAIVDLHKAVAAMTALLPDDEAERAAQDLKELSEEAVKDKPRPAFWQRAVDGLLAAAKRTAEVGTPVVELIASVVRLLG